jgi:hypothetical protein
MIGHDGTMDYLMISAIFQTISNLKSGETEIIKYVLA